MAQKNHSLTLGNGRKIAETSVVGPYVLHNVLGKGQTGVVKLGIHSISKKKVAIKIIDRTTLSPNVIAKVEREITIMKLIEHPNVLGLFDVYENKRHLYLVLEHVAGGELFDYLVKRGRLSLHEAKAFFRQIISAVDFCHQHLICHRDLKPENLLLDERKNIKIADFGMASLQVGDNMLETSCGSPHYACPEVVRGIKYDGRKADVWSCGVILYALIVGSLPFDDDNLRHLLDKVKKGVFTVPSFVPMSCRDLLSQMIQVDPEKRLTMAEVKKHIFITSSYDELKPELPVQQIVQVHPIEDENEIDADILVSMTSLGCFKDQALLIEQLLNDEQTIERVIYFLLLARKDRAMSFDDDSELLKKHSSHADLPRKRIDSPGSSRKLASPDGRKDDNLRRPRARTVGCTVDELQPLERNIPISLDNSPGSPWRHKFMSIKKTIGTGTARLSRRKGSFLQSDERLAEEMLPGSSPDLSVKRSWFPNFIFHAHGDIEPYILHFRDRSSVQLKSDFLQTLLMLPKLRHSIVSQFHFRIEYRKNKGLFQNRITSLSAVIVPQNSDPGVDDNNEIDGHRLIITFADGSQRKFRKICNELRAKLNHETDSGVSTPSDRERSYSRNCESPALLTNLEEAEYPAEYPISSSYSNSPDLLHDNPLSNPQVASMVAELSLKKKLDMDI